LLKFHIAIYAFYEIVQIYFRHAGAVPYIMLIQPEHHFTFSGIASLAPVDLYIGVRRVIEHKIFPVFVLLQIFGPLFFFEV
jgi:hypothetical protein